MSSTFKLKGVRLVVKIKLALKLVSEKPKHLFLKENPLVALLLIFYCFDLTDGSIVCATSCHC